MAQPITVSRLFRDLHQPKFHIYTISKQTDAEPDTPTIDYLEALEKSNRREFEKMMALLEYVAEHGPILNDITKSRFLNKEEGILEFKTSGGARVAYFYDRGSVIVCTQGFNKPPKKELQQEIDTAVKWKRQYFAAKASGTLSVE